MREEIKIAGSMFVVAVVIAIIFISSTSIASKLNHYRYVGQSAFMLEDKQKITGVKQATRYECTVYNDQTGILTLDSEELFNNYSEGEIIELKVYKTYSGENYVEY